uniref:SH3 domain-containing protein n=1 Tax=Periophthalmus magnuspinnatus TaxID=409849 RepID=A0A3B4BMN8_9GOBI
MARFQANGSSSEDVPSTGPGRIKQPVHATLSGQPLHMKKPLSDSGATIPPKSSFLKNTPSKSDIVVQEVNKTKALASIFTNPQEDTSPPFTKHKLPSKSSFIQMPEPIAPPTKPSMIVSRTEPKPAFPKPAVISTKPNWIKEDSTSSPPPPAPKIPAVPLKPNSNFVKLQQQREANVQHTKAEVITDPVIKPTLPIIPVAKPTSNMRTAQTLFNKEPAEQETCMKPSAVNKLPLSNSIPPPKPLTSKKPSLKKPSPHINNSDPSGPKKNPLPNSLALGPAPAKPNRPPHVKLDVFEGGLKTPADGKICTKHYYRGCQSYLKYCTQESKEEATEQKQEKKKVKDIKEERKRLEAERKEQKEREKKEQEAKKKFKLVGPVEVLQKGKARADFKGNKTDLSLKQGDSLDIIRIHGNPEGKWLGRSLDGSIGYVKITSVEIDFNSLKQQGAGQAHEPELYDDIDVYEGEITVLDQVTIIPNLTNKKWSSKELPLKAGEKLDVIVKAIDNKLICRNEDGKCESCARNDGDIYDDIGDGMLLNYLKYMSSSTNISLYKDCM